MFTLDLDLWTPAIVGGATPRMVDKESPIRAPSVRGVLRWWFRAGASSVLLVKNEPRGREGMLDALRAAEREIFGDTTQRSRLVVLPPHGGDVVTLSVDQDKWAGLRYLGYGLFESTPQAVVTRPESQLASTAVSRPISLRLDLRRVGPGDRISEAHERLLAATAWLWLHFGGIGARSRRGWGSLGLVKDHQNLFAGIPAVSVPGILDLIQPLLAGLDQATAIFREYLPQLNAGISTSGANPHPGMGTIHPDIRTIDGIEELTVIPGEHATPIQALDAAGRLFLGFRSTLARRRFGLPPLPDYHSVKASLQGRTVARKVERAAFGLPLPFYFRSLGGAKTRFVPVHGKNDRDKQDRLASPLFFRVHRVGSGKQARYVTAIVNFADRAEPLGDRGLWQEPSQSSPGGRVVERPSGAILKEFLK